MLSDILTLRKLNIDSTSYNHINNYVHDVESFQKYCSSPLLFRSNLKCTFIGNVKNLEERIQNRIKNNNHFNIYEFSDSQKNKTTYQVYMGYIQLGKSY